MVVVGGLYKNILAFKAFFLLAFISRAKNNGLSGKWWMKEKLVSLPQQRQKKQKDEGERRRNRLAQFVLSLPRGQRGDGGAKEGRREGKRERVKKS